MRVILASGSPRRRELLTALVDQFEVVEPGTDERSTSDAVADARRLATEKALAVATPDPAAIVVAADTIVFNGRRSFGKPGSPGEARGMLRALRGRDHRVVTGVAVAHDGRVLVADRIADVTIRRLTDAEIDSYVASGIPMDKAGAYAVQDDAFAVVSAVEGCFCSVMGLPLWELRALLAHAGLEGSSPEACYRRCAGCPDRPRESA